MSSIGLNIGLRGLLAAQSALDTIGHNISNAATEGYSRQKLQLSTAMPQRMRGLTFGGGVQADFVQRTTDQLLHRRIVTQTSVVSRLDSMLIGMAGVEAMLGEPGGFGLGALMDGLFQSLSALSADPGDTVLQTGVTQAGVNITSQFHHLSDQLGELRNRSEEQVEILVSEVNARAELIAGLNREIAKAEATGMPANDLRDKRELTVKQMAELIDVTYDENQAGAVQVLVKGQLLVSPTGTNLLEARRGDDGIEIFVEGGTQPVGPTGGAIGGMLAVADNFVPDFQGKIDTFAHQLILNTNRAHSTGTPPDGGFTALTGAYGIHDQDGDGDRLDELLSNSGLPFDVQDGLLHVHIEDVQTGAIATHRIAIDASRTTVGDFLDAIDALDGVSANLDSLGRMRLTAAGGHRFDFSQRLNGAPDEAGSFGGRRASLGSSLQGPYDLAAGSTLSLQGSTSTFTVTFDPTDFVDISAATAEEVADAINSDPGMSANFLRAVAVGDQLVLQTMGEGAGQSFTVTGGSALGDLGLVASTTATGQDLAVDVAIHGQYEGSTNQQLVYRPLTDGTIGATNGLQVEVRTSSGALVTTLNVGAGYVPGTELDVADGVRVSFSFGDVSASDNDAFVSDLIADSDTADVLVALGLNSFYVGSDAGSIELREDLANDPSRLSTSATGERGDNGVLLQLMQMQHEDVDELGGTLGEFYNSIVGKVGFDISSTENTLEVEEFLTASLEARRDQVSGVNVDEELVNMIQFEQAFAAASQFIQVVNTLHDEVLNLL